MVKFGRYNLSLPSGTLKRDLLKSLIKLANLTEEEFIENL